MKVSERLDEIQSILEKTRGVLAECWTHVRAIKLSGDDVMSYDNINDIDHDIETADYLLNDLLDKMKWMGQDVEDAEYRKEREEEK